MASITSKAETHIAFLVQEQSVEGHCFSTNQESVEKLHERAIPEFCNLEPWRLLFQCLWNELIHGKKKFQNASISIKHQSVKTAMGVSA